MLSLFRPFSWVFLPLFLSFFAPFPEFFCPLSWDFLPPLLSFFAPFPEFFCPVSWVFCPFSWVFLPPFLSFLLELEYVLPAFESLLLYERFLWFPWVHLRIEREINVIQGSVKICFLLFLFSLWLVVSYERFHTQLVWVFFNLFLQDFDLLEMWHLP